MSDERAEIRRLSIQGGETKASPMRVYCPRREHDVSLDDCNACSSCVGISMRDAYVVCGWDPSREAREDQANETMGAPVARETQDMRAAHSPAEVDRSPSSSPFGLAPLARFEGPVVMASLDDSALEAAQLMRDKKVGCVVVVRDRRPIGMLTDRDLVLRVVAERLDPAAVLVSSIVTYEAATVSRGDGFETAVRLMRKHGVRRLPIVDDEGRVTGIVTADDLIGLLGNELAALGEAIEGNVDGSESR